MREIRTIAQEINNNWESPYFAAKPYLKAMHFLHSPTDYYHCDTASTIILYFLANANTWKGKVARRIKKELKDFI